MPRPNRGPYLKANERGVWEIRWTEDRRSRRLSTRTDNLQAAQQALAGFLAAQEREEALNARGTLPVADVLDLYLREHVARRVGDADRQENAIRWLTDGLGAKLAHELTDNDIQRYVDKRTKGVIGFRPVKPATVRRELNCLIAAINYAARQRKISRDGLPHIELPEHSEPREFWLTEAEVSELLLEAERMTTEAGRMTRAHRYLVLGLATAARGRAIERLTWDLVDRAAWLIRYDLLSAEDQRRKRSRRSATKRRVPVPVAEWAQPWVQQAWDERTSDYVLDDDRFIRRALEAVCKRAAKRYDNPRFVQVHPHALRHTAATHMLRAGVDPWRVAAVLGDSLQTVLKTYGHHCPDHLRSAVNIR